MHLRVKRNRILIFIRVDGTEREVLGLHLARCQHVEEGRFARGRMEALGVDLMA